MRIAIIGAGNVATRLGLALAPTNEIVQVLARHSDSASRLASAVNSLRGDDHCRAIDNPAELLPDADLYLVAVNDDAIASVAAATPDTPGIWAHTSGSVGMDVFAPYKRRYGVFYPLQTLSRELEIATEDIPMLIEASDDAVAETLMQLASTVSGNVRRVDSATRASLHVAAVFACNFSCLMWLYADRLLEPCGMSLSDMVPLISATLDKAALISPEKGMTGPARRGDLEVIRKHLDRLASNPDMQKVYADLSQQILNIYHPATDVENRLRPDSNPCPGV